MVYRTFHVTAEAILYEFGTIMKKNEGKSLFAAFLSAPIDIFWSNWISIPVIDTRFI